MEPDTWEPEDEDDYEAVKAELKRRFAAWADDKGLEVERDGPEGLLHYKWAYVDQHLTRWRRRDLYEIYLEIYPAKVMAEADELDEILAETKTFITFLAETELLDGESESPEMLCDFLDEIAPEFREHMADTSRYSFGKRGWKDYLFGGCQQRLNRAFRFAHHRRADISRDSGRRCVDYFFA